MGNTTSVSSSLLTAFGTVKGEGSLKLKRFVIVPYDRRYRIWQTLLVIISAHIIQERRFCPSSTCFSTLASLLGNITNLIVHSVARTFVMFLSKLESPELFGEIGVIFNMPQPFTMRSKRLSQVVRISHHHFKQLMQPLNADGKRILSNFLQHLKGMAMEELQEIPHMSELLSDLNSEVVILFHKLAKHMA